MDITVDEPGLLTFAKELGLVDPDATEIPRRLRSQVIATAHKIAQAQDEPEQQSGLAVTITVKRGDTQIYSTSFTIPDGATP